MRRTSILLALITGLASLVLMATARSASAAPSDYPVGGIDVSNWQGSINWSSVAGSGVAFAYAKATEGMGYVDPTYTANRNGARANGLYFGAYAFGRPDEGNPRGQADKLVDVSLYTRDGRTLPPMLDIEWPNSGPACYGLSTGAIVTWISAFVDQIRVRTGQLAMIYTNANWWNPCTGSSAAFGSYPLFVARYETTPNPLPAGWTHWTLWQYTSSGSVPGVAGGVDRDVFNGSLAGLAALCGQQIGMVELAGGELNRDGYTDLLAIEAATGKLWLYPGLSGGAGFGARVQVGSSWGSMRDLVVGRYNPDGYNDLLTVDSTTGALWLYPGLSSGAGFGARVQVGSSWGSMSKLTGGELNRDAYTDLLAIDGAGVLWLYPGINGTGFGARVLVGTSWGAMTNLTGGEFNRDGHTDLLTVEAATGKLWLYPGLAGGAGFGARVQVGSSWGGMSDLTGGEFNRDAHTDLLAVDDSTGKLWLYPGLAGGAGFGTRVMVGSGGW